MSGGSFVWIRGLRGPVPEKWPHDMPAGGREGKHILRERKLSASEFALKISILEQRYPPPDDTPPPDPAPVAPKSPRPSPAKEEVAA